MEILKELRKKYNLFKLNKSLKHLKSIGDYNDISHKTIIFHPNKMEIGSYIYIGPGARINALGGVEIHDGTIIGPNLSIYSANHMYKNAKFIPYDESFEFRRVIIGENVWIGANVILVPGAEIGEGSIIGAGAVVAGKIPPLSIVVGNPCKIISNRDEREYFELKKEGKIYLKYKKEKKTLK
ncbi:acyltransferase [Zhouia sp. PK063]|uniref:acyltransferase n=1 Tax=Zhouia sp. PK063 TaxID=3373602 RepID=UPI00378A2283